MSKTAHITVAAAHFQAVREGVRERITDEAWDDYHDKRGEFA